MILWRNIFFFTFYHFDSDPRFPPFLQYVRWKSGVTFVRRCFCDGKIVVLIVSESGQYLLFTFANTALEVSITATHFSTFNLICQDSLEVIYALSKNQRTIGPVNAHLIS